MPFVRHVCFQFDALVLCNNLRTFMPLRCGMYLPNGRICLCMATLIYRQQSFLQGCVHLTASLSCRRHMHVFCVLCWCVCVDVCALKAQNLHKYTSLCSSCKHAGVKDQVMDELWAGLGLISIHQQLIINTANARLLLVNI
jgi:hypothetical protein